jgi:hypothetical protein
MISLVIPASPERSPRWTNVAVRSAKEHIRDIGEVIVAYWGERPIGYDGRAIVCPPYGRPYNGGLLKNFGARATVGDYLVFLDADAQIHAPIRLDTESVTTTDVYWESRDGIHRGRKKGANEGMVMIGIPRSTFFEVQGFRESFIDWGGEDIDLLFRARPMVEKDVRLRNAKVRHRWHIPKTMTRSAVKELNLAEGNHEQIRSMVDQTWWGKNAYLVCFDGPVPKRLPRGVVGVEVAHWDQVTARGPSMLIGGNLNGEAPKEWIRDSRLQIFRTWGEGLKRLPAPLGRRK